MKQLRSLFICLVGLAILVGRCPSVVAADDVVVARNGMVVSVSPPKQPALDSKLWKKAAMPLMLPSPWRLHLRLPGPKPETLAAADL